MLTLKIARTVSGIFLLAGSSAGCLTVNGMPMNMPSDSVNDAGMRTKSAGPFSQTKEDPASADVLLARKLEKTNDPVNCVVSRSLMAKWAKADASKDRAAELNQDLEELQNKDRISNKDIAKCVEGTEYQPVWEAQQKAKAEKEKAAADAKKAAAAKTADAKAAKTKAKKVLVVN